MQISSERADNRIHIFLTGGIQVGKSTMLRRLLAEFPAVPCAGFRTVTGPGPEGSIGAVYLVPADGETLFLPERKVGLRLGHARGIESFPAAFDEFGTACIEAPGRLILMDEIGRMEREAPRFSEAVLRRLDGDTPILGVVQSRADTPLANAIRCHEKVLLAEVTPENREEVFAQLLRKMRWQMKRFVDSAGAVVFREHEGKTQVLMIYSKHKSWGFPKGHIERGENPAAAARREVLEETGIRIELLSDRGFAADAALMRESRQIHYFPALVRSGALSPQPGEVRAAEWQDAQRVKELLYFREDVEPFVWALQQYRARTGRS